MDLWRRFRLTKSSNSFFVFLSAPFSILASLFYSFSFLFLKIWVQPDWWWIEKKKEVCWSRTWLGCKSLVVCIQQLPLPYSKKTSCTNFNCASFLFYRANCTQLISLFFAYFGLSKWSSRISDLSLKLKRQSWSYCKSKLKEYKERGLARCLFIHKVIMRQNGAKKQTIVSF